jgi:hypothetical protein
MIRRGQPVPGRSSASDYACKTAERNVTTKEGNIGLLGGGRKGAGAGWPNPLWESFLTANWRHWTRKRSRYKVALRKSQLAVGTCFVRACKCAKASGHRLGIGAWYAPVRQRTAPPFRKMNE